MVPGQGPHLNAFRAFVNNDNWTYSNWFRNGLHNLKHKATSYEKMQNPDGSLTISFTIRSQAPNGARHVGGTDMNYWGKYTSSIEEDTSKPFGDDDFHFITRQFYTVHPDGSVEVQSNITSNNERLVLPRLGYQLQVPDQFSKFDYYGRGPVGNYNDRRTGSFIEQFSSTVMDQVESFPKPQEMANHEETRWCALTNQQGNGAIFIANNSMSVQALPYSAIDMTTAAHAYELKTSGKTYLNLDLGVTGLGGTSCGQAPPFEQDRITGKPSTFGFIIRPLRSADNPTKVGNVRAMTVAPVAIERTETGMVYIRTTQSDADIVYTVDGDTTQYAYTGPFDYRRGGTIASWAKGYQLGTTTATFDKITTIPIKVVYCDSEENKAEDAPASNLVDGNPNTFWHTMYSVTMASFPHVVDFDCYASKNLTGFTYLPRQDSFNGNIRDYEILVSDDGQNWSEPVSKGRFERNQEKKTVKFDKPVKARYLRFRALSSHDRQDYATGAEFNIMAEE